MVDWAFETNAKVPNTSQRFPILHALRVKGFASTEAVSEFAGTELTAAELQLGELLSAGAARLHEARRVWQLTPAGQDLHAHELAADLASMASDRREEMRNLYQSRLLPLNSGFKQLCTEWQLKNGSVNDHRDRSYDQAVVAKLKRSHRTLVPVCGALCRIARRYGTYQPRFESAILRLDSGEPGAFAGVLCGSYHDVWMELHQDLILTLGVDRHGEGSF